MSQAYVLDTSAYIDLDRVDLGPYAAVTPVLTSVGVEEAKLYGVLATLVRAAGRTPRPRRPDLQIAATAAAARLPLLTCNPADSLASTE